MEINYLNFFFFWPGKRHVLQCMGNMGICRTSCKKDEHPYLYCRNYQSCCLQSYMRISISGEEGKNDWSQENSWPKISWVLVITILNLLLIYLIKIHALDTLVCLSTFRNYVEVGICVVRYLSPSGSSLVREKARKPEWKEERGESIHETTEGRLKGFGRATT